MGKRNPRPFSGRGIVIYCLNFLKGIIAARINANAGSESQPPPPPLPVPEELPDTVTVNCFDAPAYELCA